MSDFTPDATITLGALKRIARDGDCESATRAMAMIAHVPAGVTVIPLDARYDSLIMRAAR